MRVVVFDLYGKFAHFRKFYTNSSSLTYGIPPRTTIAGIVAAILGLERDSYYELFSSENLFIGVNKLSKTRKLLQTLNYMKATSMAELIAPKDHTQVPFEILAGEDNVVFRIYLSHKDTNTFVEIDNRIKNNDITYPPYLGSASFGCNITYVGTYDAEVLDCKDYIKLNTAIRSSDIEEINIENYTGRLIKERMPVDFYNGRTIKEVTTYIYDDEGNFIEVKLKDKFVKLSNGDVITFM